jgi:hypothetical protein
MRSGVLQQLDPADSVSRYTGSGPAKEIIMIVVGGLLYVLPAMLAFKRQSRRRWTVLAVNVLLGWTVIGWIAALAMTFAYEAPPDGSEPDREHIPGTSRE